MHPTNHKTPQGRLKIIEEKFPGHNPMVILNKALTNAGKKPQFQIGDTVYYADRGDPIETSMRGEEKVFEYLCLEQAIVTGVNLYSYEEFDYKDERITSEEEIKKNTFYVYTLNSMNRNTEPFTELEASLFSAEDRKEYLEKVIEKLQDELGSLRD